MRTATLDGRLVLVLPAGGTDDPALAQEVALDVATASAGRFGPDPMSAFTDWPAFVAWAAQVSGSGVDTEGAGSLLDRALEPVLDRARLGPPVPRPPQIFAIGVNYREHADEAGYPPDSLPVTFTKFLSSLAGPLAEVPLPPGNVDWEVELVVAIGVGGSHIAHEDAWTHVAGLTVGQDLSERLAQMAGARPQYSLAKSHPGFSPTGPWLVTPDELPDPADLAISCALDGEVMQSSRTSRMIYDVPELLVRLSAVVTLLPGDIIFTGTPSGVGNARTPKRFIAPGQVLRSEIEGLGWIEQRFHAPSSAADMSSPASSSASSPDSSTSHGGRQDEQ